MASNSFVIYLQISMQVSSPCLHSFFFFFFFSFCKKKIKNHKRVWCNCIHNVISHLHNYLWHSIRCEGKLLHTSSSNSNNRKKKERKKLLYYSLRSNESEIINIDLEIISINEKKKKCLRIVKCLSQAKQHLSQSSTTSESLFFYHN